MKATGYVGFVGIVTAGVFLAASARVALGEGRAERAAARKAAIAEKKADASEARDERKTAREEKVSELREKGEQNTDNRQERQEKRIQHGINKGYLTENEVKELTAQQDAIAALEASFKSDGKLTKDEYTALRRELNEASRSIWAAKHDTEGNQMAAYRLGRNVFASSSLTDQLANPDLTQTEAKALTKDFRRIIELKKTLSGELSDADRTTLQAEFDALLNKYFTTK